MHEDGEIVFENLAVDVALELLDRKFLLELAMQRPEHVEDDLHIPFIRVVAARMGIDNCVHLASHGGEDFFMQWPLRSSERRAVSGEICCFLLIANR